MSEQVKPKGFMVSSESHVTRYATKNRTGACPSQLTAGKSEQLVIKHERQRYNADQSLRRRLAYSFEHYFKMSTWNLRRGTYLMTNLPFLVLKTDGGGGGGGRMLKSCKSYDALCPHEATFSTFEKKSSSLFSLNFSLENQ